LVDTKRRAMQTLKKFIVGYEAAEKATEIPARRLERMVERCQIRAIKPNRRTIMFVPEHLIEDLMSMEVEKI
jgi:hypothetical protein